MNNLVPFQKDKVTENFQVEASFFQRSEFEVHVEFKVHGPMDKILSPTPEDPTRRDELWKSTCLEAFLSLKKGGYLEINCSPSGHWNAYAFTGYREGMRPADHITVRLTRTEKEAQLARFFIQVISEEKLELNQVGLSMVLESTAHEKSYWALRHPGPQPDFHKSEAWTLPPTPATR